MPFEDSNRKQSLYQAKLRALVRPHADVDASVMSGFPGGAALRVGDAGWVLVEERPERGLGGALAWGNKAGVAALHVIVPGAAAAGALARQAPCFRSPPTVWVVQGKEITTVAAVAPPLPRPLSEAAGLFAEVIWRAGAEPVVEGGVLTGEVLGLEVCRVVEDEYGTRLEVGVGKHDREAHKLAGETSDAARDLAVAVAAVRQVRTADALPQQMNRLAAERWLRLAVGAHPEWVDALHLEPLAAFTVRDDLRLTAPAVARGRDAAGRGVVVACSTGIDVDLVPQAADARLAADPTARLVLVLPEPDVHPVTRDLAARLVDPAEVVTVGADWRRHYAG